MISCAMETASVSFIGTALKASAVSLVAQKGKQARDISAKELKIGGLEVGQSQWCVDDGFYPR